MSKPDPGPALKSAASTQPIRSLADERQQLRLTFKLSSALVKKLTYLSFVALFGLEIAAATLIGHPPALSPFMWGLLVLAVLRGARCIAFDTVLQPLRAPFVAVVPHDSGAGATTCARTDHGPIAEVIGELLCCPICNGTHLASLLYLGLALAPAFFGGVTVVLSLIGAAEWLQALLEYFQWRGELARHTTGPLVQANRARETREV